MLRVLMEPLLIIFFFVAVMVFLQNRTKERQERMRILEEALRSGHLDAATKAELVGELTGRRVPPPGTPPGTLGSGARTMVGGGWLGLLTGIGLMLMGHRDSFQPGVVLACAGFAILSLPYVIREFERERGRSRT